MEPRPLTEIVTDHITHHQDSSESPTSQVDQIHAAAMDGARTFDTLGDAGRQAGTFSADPADGTTLLKLLLERCADPQTQLRPCRHLTATPLQPQYIHAAAPTRVSCKACYAIFSRTHAKAVTRYAASTDCDVCDAQVEILHLCLLSNGLVTFTVNICAACRRKHQRTLDEQPSEL